MTTITWTINQLDRNTADGFVTTAHYNVSAVDGDFAASTYGTVGFTQEEGAAMVPYADLVESTVVGWVQEKLDQAVVEASLVAQIDAQKNPVTATGKPW